VPVVAEPLLFAKVPVLEELLLVLPQYASGYTNLPFAKAESPPLTCQDQVTHPLLGQSAKVLVLAKHFQKDLHHPYWGRPETVVEAVQIRHLVLRNIVALEILEMDEPPAVAEAAPILFVFRKTTDRQTVFADLPCHRPC